MFIREKLHDNKIDFINAELYNNLANLLLFSFQLINLNINLNPKEEEQIELVQEINIIIYSQTTPYDNEQQNDISTQSHCYNNNNPFAQVVYLSIFRRERELIQSYF